jgi:HEAT repeat protein
VAIGRLGEEALAPLIAGLDSSDVAQREVAADLLFAMDPSGARAMPALTRAVAKDPSLSVRLAALRSIGHLGPRARRAVDELRAVATNKKEDV